MGFQTDRIVITIFKAAKFNNFACLITIIFPNFLSVCVSVCAE